MRPKPTREAPASARPPEPRSARPPAGPSSTRTEELAQLYRKIADLQSELVEAETRLEKARAESAGADESAGQMLAHVADVEGRLRAAQKQAEEAEQGAAEAEARAGEMAAQLGKTRAELSSVRRELTAARAEAAAEREKLRGEFEVLHDEDEARWAELVLEVEELKTQRGLEQEEREKLRAQVSALAEVQGQRDKAMLREELLEADLEATRRDLGEARRQATSGQHRVDAEVLGKLQHLEQLQGEVQQASSRNKWIEKELAAARRQIESLRSAAEEKQASLDAAERRLVEQDMAVARATRSAEEATRGRNAVKDQLEAAILELDEMSREKVALAQQVTAAEAATEAQRAETKASEDRLAELEIEREMHDGLAARTNQTHEADLERLRLAHAEELAQAQAEGDARVVLEAQLAALTGERDALATEAQGLRQDLEATRASAADAQEQLRGAVESVGGLLAELERCDAEAAQARAAALLSARAVLERVASAEQAPSIEQAQSGEHALPATGQVETDEDDDEATRVFAALALDLG